MLTVAVSFADHTERIRELLEKKLRAGMGAAAKNMADEYSTSLGKEAPPHSAPGQIPRAYFGHKPGGFGPLAGEGQVQNIPEFGFSARQEAFLSTYIHGVAGAEGQKLQGLIGFRDSHVTSRRQNYLLQWDQGTVPGTSKRRPWVRPVYDKNKNQMSDAFRRAFRGTR